MSEQLVTEWISKAEDYERMANGSYKSECHSHKRAELRKGALVLRMCAKQLQEYNAKTGAAHGAQDSAAESAATARQVRPRTQRRQTVAEGQGQPEAQDGTLAARAESPDQEPGQVDLR